MLFKLLVGCFGKGLMVRLTVAKEEVPDSEKCVERQVTCEQTHQPVGGKHERLHSVLL